jgi:hypothetical protein
MPAQECFTKPDESDGEATALAAEALNAHPMPQKLRCARSDFENFLAENYKNPGFPFIEAASEVAGSLFPNALAKQFTVS